MPVFSFAKSDSLNTKIDITGTKATEATKAWTEGDDLIAAAFVWIAERYERLPHPRPVVVGPEWAAFETDINRAYDTRDDEQLRRAVRKYCRFAVNALKADARAPR